MKLSMCENCIKYKTIYCPNSDKCLAREDKPFYEDKYTILTRNEALEGVLKDYTKENQQLKLINKEYERLNKEKGRGFKIINVQEYDIYELLSYKNNWNELREWLKANDIHYAEAIPFKETLRKMEELERGVSDVED